MKPDQLTLQCEPFAPRAGLSGNVHGPWTMRKITVARPAEGQLDQELHCPACDATLVLRTDPWAATAKARRPRRLLLLAVLGLTVGWSVAAVLAVPALRLPLVLAAVPLLFVLLALATRLAAVTGAELTEGVDYDGTHPRHKVT